MTHKILGKTTFSGETVWHAIHGARLNRGALISLEKHHDNLVEMSQHHIANHAAENGRNGSIGKKNVFGAVETFHGLLSTSRANILFLNRLDADLYHLVHTSSHERWKNVFHL